MSEIEPTPAQPNDGPTLREHLAHLLETYTLASILIGLREYTQTKASVLRAVESDRVHQWVGLTKLLDTAIAVAVRIGSEEERRDDSLRDNPPG